MAGVFVFGQAPFAVDDELNGHGAAHTVFSGRGDGFVKGIGVQRVAIVVNGNQSLQRSANVVELNFLRVQRTARRLNVVLQFLAAFVGAVLVLHGHRPNAARHAAHHGVFGVHAIAKEKAQVGRKIVNVHTARQVGFDKSEAIGKREGQLTNGVRTCFGNVIATDGNRVEIAHIVVDKKLRNVAHDFQAELGAEDTSVLALVFFQNVGLHGTAYVGHHPCANFGRFSVGGFAAVVGFEFFQILIDGGVHEHGQNRWRRTIDGHRHAGAGVAQVKAAIQHFHVVQGGNAHARVAHFAVNVWTRIGVVAVQRDRVKGCGQTLGRHACT